MWTGPLVGHRGSGGGEKGKVVMHDDAEEAQEQARSGRIASATPNEEKTALATSASRATASSVGEQPRQH